MSNNDDLFGFNDQEEQNETKRPKFDNGSGYRDSRFNRTERNDFAFDNDDDDDDYTSGGIDVAFFKKRTKGAWVVLLVFMILFSIRLVSEAFSFLTYQTLLDTSLNSYTAEQIDAFEQIARFTLFCFLTVAPSFAFILTAFIMSAKIKKISKPNSSNKSQFSSIIVILVLALISLCLYLIANFAGLGMDVTALDTLSDFEGFSESISSSVVGSSGAIIVAIVFVSLQIAKFIKLKGMLSKKY